MRIIQNILRSCFIINRKNKADEENLKARVSFIGNQHIHSEKQKNSLFIGVKRIFTLIKQSFPRIARIFGFHVSPKVVLDPCVEDALKRMYHPTSRELQAMQDGLDAYSNKTNTEQFTSDLVNNLHIIESRTSSATMYQKIHVAYHDSSPQAFRQLLSSNFNYAICFDMTQQVLRTIKDVMKEASEEERIAVIKSLAEEAYSDTDIKKVVEKWCKIKTSNPELIREKLSNRKQEKEKELSRMQEGIEKEYLKKDIKDIERIISKMTVI